MREDALHVNAGQRSDWAEQDEHYYRGRLLTLKYGTVFKIIFHGSSLEEKSARMNPHSPCVLAHLRAKALQDNAIIYDGIVLHAIFKAFNRAFQQALGLPRYFWVASKPQHRRRRHRFDVKAAVLGTFLGISRAVYRLQVYSTCD